LSEELKRGIFGRAKLLDRDGEIDFLAALELLHRKEMEAT
jgi:hypothetical protein